MVTVLVVDDLPSARILLRAQLRAAGADIEVVAEANDGADAVARAAASRPDVILLDERMPLANGSEVLPRLREVSPDSRIIMLTAHVDEHLAASDRGAANADGCLEKGSPLRELIDLIRG